MHPCCCRRTWACSTEKPLEGEFTAPNLVPRVLRLLGQRPVAEFLKWFLVFPYGARKRGNIVAETQNFGFINWVDKVDCPPSRGWKLTFRALALRQKLDCCRNILAEACFPKCFPVCAHRRSETKHVSVFFIPQTFCFCNKCFPVCAPRKQCWLDSRVAEAAFRKLSMRKLLFSLKCFLVIAARKHCFSLVCAPKEDSWKRCVRNNVSSFAGAFSFVLRPPQTRKHCYGSMFPRMFLGRRKEREKMFLVGLSYKHFTENKRFCMRNFRNAARTTLASSQHCFLGTQTRKHLLRKQKFRVHA